MDYIIIILLVFNIIIQFMDSNGNVKNLNNITLNQSIIMNQIKTLNKQTNKTSQPKKRKA